MSFLVNGNLVVPGAYVVNGYTGSGTSGPSGTLPLFCSVPKTDYMSATNVADGFIIMPGFTVIVWTGYSYTGTGYVYSNKPNNNIMCVTMNPYPNNIGGSFQLFYNGVEIPDTNMNSFNPLTGSIGVVSAPAKNTYP